MTPSRPFVLAALFLALLTAGCESRKAPIPALAPVSAPPDPEAPPTPPLYEDFEEKPKISLFPRIGDYRPEEKDEIGLPFWRTYMEHVTRTSGTVVLPSPVGRGRVFSFRGVAGLPSLGFFSPLAVDPETTYQVSVLVKAELPEGAVAGIGILEYDRFLWVAEQFPRSLDDRHRTGSQIGVHLFGAPGWRQSTFSFTTGANTRMVHLIFFREGAIDRSPVMVDEIRVEKVKG